MDDCLLYFRQAVADPSGVPPWSEWWAANEEVVRRVFPPLDYVRLKHRKLRGARQILQRAGELPEDYYVPSPLLTGSCGDCGERTSTHSGGSGGGYITCTICGMVSMYDCGPREPDEG